MFEAVSFFSRQSLAVFPNAVHPVYESPMTLRLQTFLTGAFALIVAALLALTPASANPTSGGYQLFEQTAPEHQAAIQLAALENFDYHAKTASEYAKVTNRVATQADVAQHFQQNRRFWSSDPIQFNGNRVYQRNDLFDPSQTSTWRQGGRDVTGTNLDRMAAGRAPLDATGNPVNLHHMTQSQNGAIAEVTQSFHSRNNGVIHINPNTVPSGINRSQFDTWRGQYWRNRATTYGE